MGAPPRTDMAINLQFRGAGKWGLGRWQPSGMPACPAEPVRRLQEVRAARPVIGLAGS